MKSESVIAAGVGAGTLTASVMAELRERAARRQVGIESAIREIVEVESPSGDVEGSRGVVELLTQRARAIESVSAVEQIEVPDYGVHLRFTAFAGDAATDDARPILLLGHTDTVHPRGSLAARPWREDRERIFAPGIFDMKANCVVALEALRLCAEAQMNPRRPVRLLLACDEESGSEWGRALVEEEAQSAACVLVLEPSAPGGKAKTARKGTGWWKISARGRASHAGLDPQAGASAILELARHTERFHSMTDYATGTTFNVGTFHGGTCSNVIAAEAVAELDARFSTIAEAERVAAQLESLTSFDARVSLAVEGEINRPPFERTPEVVALYEHASRIAEMLGEELGEASVGGASDGNFAAALCPAVLDGLGLQGGGAHSVDEHIMRSDIPFRIALLAGLLRSL